MTISKTESKPPGKSIWENTKERTIAPPPRTALTLDVKKYQSLLDAEDISEDQKQEFIETLWSIVVSFVDLGFGIHPLQQAGEAGQNETGQELFELITDMNMKPLELQQTEREKTPERKDA